MDRRVAAALGILHAGCLAAPFCFTWSGAAIALALCFVTGALGVTLGFHRLLTHHSFKTYPWLRNGLTICGCLAWQGSPVQWVGVHRIHHKHSDKPGDPHSPIDGFWWSHVWWVTLKNQGLMTSWTAAAAAQDLCRDQSLRRVNRYYWLYQFVLAAGLVAGGYAADGWDLAASWLVYGVFVRTVVVYHATWAVNSASHCWGYRNFNTADDSRNNWWVAAMTFGEGWHNNHHAHQRSASHGMRWYELDVTYWIILMMEKLGLAWDVVRPPRLDEPGDAPLLGAEAVELMVKTEGMSDA